MNKRKLPATVNRLINNNPVKQLIHNPVFTNECLAAS